MGLLNPTPSSLKPSWSACSWCHLLHLYGVLQSVFPLSASVWPVRLLMFKGQYPPGPLRSLAFEIQPPCYKKVHRHLQCTSVPINSIQWDPSHSQHYRSLFYLTVHLRLSHSVVVIWHLWLVYSPWMHSKISWPSSSTWLSNSSQRSYKWEKCDSHHCFSKFSSLTEPTTI